MAKVGTEFLRADLDRGFSRSASAAGGCLERGSSDICGQGRVELLR